VWWPGAITYLKSNGTDQTSKEAKMMVMILLKDR
jgi:hypothetical protein